MRPVIHCLLILSISCGCTTSLFDTRAMNIRKFGLEQRVVNQFVDALNEDKEAALRNSTSTRFEQKALRSPTAFRDLEILSLPKGKLTVLEMEELEDGKRQLVVADEESDDKAQFIIVRDPTKRRWVVDDVVLRQQKKGARGSKSCTEVMDLLLTLREFLDTWKSGEREDMLTLVNSDLRASLEELPEPWLLRLIGRVTAEYEVAMARRPEAQLNESDAVIKLPGRNGFLLVKHVRDGDGWLVSDVEVHNRKLEDHPGSIRRQAEAIGTVTRFLRAYQEQNQEQIQATTTETFYQGALQFADLSMLSLMPPDFAPEDFELRAYSGHLTAVIPDKNQILRIDLIEPDVQAVKNDPASAGNQPVSSKYAFMVSEVAIFDRLTMQQTNLSSAFTAPARAMLFMSALEERDIPMLRQLSGQELTKRVWNRITPDDFAALAMNGLPSGELQLQNSRVRGRKTELEFAAASGHLLNIVLADEDQQLKIEDVEFPNKLAEVVSLKSQLELTVPLIELAAAWRNSNMNAVQTACSAEFNRLVWSNVDSLPTDFSRLPELISAGIEQTKVMGSQATVVTRSDSGVRTSIQLKQERDIWVVDEILLQIPEGQTVGIRAALRKDIAQQILQSPSGTIQRASYQTTPSQTRDSSGVIRANVESGTPARGNLTLPSSSKPRPMLQPGPGPVPAAALAPAVTGESMMKFGPHAEQENSRPISYSADTAPDGTGSRTSFEGRLATIEDGDLVYFKGAAAAQPAPDTENTDTDLLATPEASVKRPKPTALSPNTPPSEPRSRRRISDPSSHPINIPLE